MIEYYSAFCMKEPWLELVLLKIKTLETRTKCLRKEGGPTVLASSLTIDEWAWNHPFIGGLLDATAKERARKGLGKLRGFSPNMGGFRLGVPGVDDNAARISIALDHGDVRWVAPFGDVQRIMEQSTVRVQTRDGVEQIVPGASQGIFRVPRVYVRVVGNG
jgi:hypothetical protein